MLHANPLALNPVTPSFLFFFLLALRAAPRATRQPTARRRPAPRCGSVQTHDRALLWVTMATTCLVAIHFQHYITASAAVMVVMFDMQVIILWSVLVG